MFYVSAEWMSNDFENSQGCGESFEKAKKQEENEDYYLNRYADILKEHNIEWGQRSIAEADVSSMDGHVVMVLIMGAVFWKRQEKVGFNHKMFVVKCKQACVWQKLS